MFHSRLLTIDCFSNTKSQIKKVNDQYNKTRPVAAPGCVGNMNGITLKSIGNYFGCSTHFYKLMRRINLRGRRVQPQLFENGEEAVLSEGQKLFL